MLYTKAFTYVHDGCGSIKNLCVLHAHAALGPYAQLSGQHDCSLCTVVGAKHNPCGICIRHVHFLAIFNILQEVLI